MSVRYLTNADSSTLINIACAAAQAKGPGFYAWRESPKFDESTGKWTHETGWGASKETREIGGTEVAEIFGDKLNGAYGERLMLTVALVVSLVARGHKVAILSKREEGTPFDPEGWLVLSIDQFPYFHLAPWDLPTAELGAAGLVSHVVPGSAEEAEHDWKKEISGNGKPDELSGLLRKLLES